MSNEAAQVHPVIMGRARTVALVNDLAAAGVEAAECVPPGEAPGPGWEWLPDSALTSGTGLALVISASGQRSALAPPFPLVARASGLSSYVALLGQPRAVGIVLVRLGHYAVGIAENETLLMPKSGHRYVHGRHRAGGQSQHRYEHNREAWMRELFDEVCEAATSRFSEYCRAGRTAPGARRSADSHGGPGYRCLDWLALGGDRAVLTAFSDRCVAMGALRQRTLPWRLPVERPGADALQRAAALVWSSRVYTQGVPE